MGGCQRLWNIIQKQDSKQGIKSNARLPSFGRETESWIKWWNRVLQGLWLTKRSGKRLWNLLRVRWGMITAWRGQLLGVNKSVNLEMGSVEVKQIDRGSSKIKRPTSHLSNPIDKTSTEVQVKTPQPIGETNHDSIKVELISAGMVYAFLIHRLFFWKRSTMNITTSIIRIRAFSPRKLITYPAVLKMKLTIEPMRPWRIPATLPPRVLKPFPTPLTTNLRPFVSALTTTPLCSDCEYNSWLRIHTSWRCFSLSLSEVPSSSLLSF